MNKCLVLAMLLMAGATTLWALENKEAESLQQGKPCDQQPVKTQRGDGGVVAASAKKAPASKRFTGTVEMYGADWCPRCRAAKQYMTEKGISFVYHNIDADAGARSAYDDLGGGIPLIVIGGKKMRGFSPVSLEFNLNNSR